MIEWFYTRAGVQQGPVSFEQLVALAAQGGLDPRVDLVWNESMTQWAISGEVPGLFPDTFVSAPTVGATVNPYSPPQSHSLEPVLAVAGPGLAEIVPGSDPIDPIACISRGFDLTKRHFPMLLLIGLVFLGCSMAPGMVLSFVDVMVQSVVARGDDASTTVSAGWLVIFVLLRIVLQVFSIFLQMGLIRVGLNFVSGRAVSLGQLFGEGGKLLRAIGATILFSIAMIFGLLLLIFPGVYIALRYGHYLTAIIDRNLGVIEAFEYSSSITTNNRGNLFLLALLNMLLFFAGVLLCCVGLIFVAPVAWLGSLVAYRWMQYGHQAAQDHPGTELPMLDGV